MSLQIVVENLLNGKKPTEEYLRGESSEALASALLARIEKGCAPSLCAHAMCSSAASGNVAVVRMLSLRPKSTFNKAYNFSEPLRRSCRAFVRANDEMLRASLGECAKLLVAANGSLDQPDKYLKSGLSAAGTLKAHGTQDALNLLEALRSIEMNAMSTELELKVRKENSIDSYQAISEAKEEVYEDGKEIVAAATTRTATREKRKRKCDTNIGSKSATGSKR